MSDLIEKLRLACDDPMWADHVEMPKKLLRHSVDYLSALKKQVEELTAERDVLEAKVIGLIWMLPDEALCGDVQSLYKRALSLRCVEAEATAMRKALEEAIRLLGRYRKETPLGHQPHMIALEVDDFVRSACAALEAAGGRG